MTLNTVGRALRLALTCAGRCDVRPRISTPPDMDDATDYTYEDDELFVRTRVTDDGDVVTGVRFRGREMAGQPRACPSTVKGQTQSIFAVLDQAGAVGSFPTSRSVGGRRKRRRLGGCPVCGGSFHPRLVTVDVGLPPARECSGCGAAVINQSFDSRRRGVSGPSLEEEKEKQEKKRRMLTLPEALDALRACINGGLPVIMWGPPGIGKTAMLEQVSQEMGRGDPIVLILSIIEPQDVGGIPYVDKPPARAKKAAGKGRSFDYARPKWLDHLGDNGILFLDELTSAGPQTMAAALRVLGERVVGFEKLPEGVAIVAAANPIEQAVGGFELPPPLANRLIHIEWPIPSVAQWSEWITNTVTLNPVAKRIVRAVVANPDWLMAKEPLPNEAWPSPRSWTRGLQAITAYDPKAGNLDRIAETILEGAVGHSVVVGLKDYLKKKVGPREILEGMPIPDSKTAPQLLRGIMTIAEQEPELVPQAFRRLIRAADEENLPEAAAGALVDRMPLLMSSEETDTLLTEIEKSPKLGPVLNTALGGTPEEIKEFKKYAEPPAEEGEEASEEVSGWKTRRARRRR